MGDGPKSGCPDKVTPNPDRTTVRVGDESHRAERQSPFAQYLFFAYLAGVPIVTFFYMISYFIWPEAVIFEKKFIYSIFPNLELEHAQLTRMGLEEFANKLENYQAGIVSLFFIINAAVYISGLPIIKYYFHYGRTIPWRGVFSLLLICCLCFAYILGFLDRTFGGANSLIINGSLDDYIFIWFMLSCGSFFLNSGIFLFIAKITDRDPKTSDLRD